MTSIIIQNLIANAIKYSHQNDKVNVRLLSSDTGVRIAVEDHGIGISTAELEELFDEYKSVNSTGTRKEKGTGLGLYVSNKLAEKMDFKLSAQSLPSITLFYLEIPYQHVIPVRKNAYA